MPSEGTCVYRKLDSTIVVMKAAKDGRRYEAAHMRIKTAGKGRSRNKSGLATK